jgi:hypothetical protein
MNRNLVGSICGRSSIKIAHFVLRVECTLFVIYHREEDLKKMANQKQEWPVAAMFINGWELNA